MDNEGMQRFDVDKLHDDTANSSQPKQYGEKEYSYYRASRVVNQRNSGEVAKDKNNLRIGTWSVRSMFEPEKIHNTIQQMKRIRVDVMGISEMRWLGTGQLTVLEKYQQTGRKGWMHDQILSMMEKRREVKNRDPAMYHDIYRDIRRNVERLRKPGSAKDKQLETSGNISDEEGNIAFGIEGKLKIREKYIQNIFTDDQRPEMPIVNTLEADSQEGLQKLVNRVAQDSQLCGLRIEYKEDSVFGHNRTLGEGLLEVDFRQESTDSNAFMFTEVVEDFSIEPDATCAGRENLVAVGSGSVQVTPSTDCNIIAVGCMIVTLYLSHAFMAKHTGCLSATEENQHHLVILKDSYTKLRYGYLMRKKSEVEDKKVEVVFEERPSNCDRMKLPLRDIVQNGGELEEFKSSDSPNSEEPTESDWEESSNEDSSTD
ncbi:hypothetical protein ILUMI_02303 [Ignelater luminosus]|uniref:Uncharacterized protein n=1 Tax=Ignelater luminosus TaxID=2038154 RepID=A0A8K0GLG9_IGNLU|nr:hypothetical protein ILUMI_02303 [Ignelater luminosus]